MKQDRHLGFADRLEVRRGADDRMQGRGIVRSTRCCSIRRDVGLGARGDTW